MSCSSEVKSELIVTGYIRAHGKNHKILIPMELFAIILMFYPKKYLCYGIGYDDCYQFALKQELEDQDKEYDPYELKAKWMYLTEISKLLAHSSFIQCNNGNVFIRNTKNEIYACGCNYHGSLGIDNTENHTIEALTKLELKVEDGSEIDIISSGQYTNLSFVVLKNNENKQIFYSFGENGDQQQGHQSGDYLYTPTKLSLNELFKDIRIKQISTGYRHSLFLSVVGRVYSCGNNDQGQCGIKFDAENRLIQPQIVPFLYDITKICCGINYNLCIDKNGALWCFGSNGYNQLGLGNEYEDENIVDTAIMNPYFKGGTDEDKIAFADCGDEHSLCINNKGMAFMFGRGCLCAQANDGSVMTPFCIQSIKGYEDVVFESGSCGYDHTVLISIKPINALYGFGENGYHQTGNLQSEVTQYDPYLTTKEDIGLDNPDPTNIVGVLCDYNTTIVICET